MEVLALLILAVVASQAYEYHGNMNVEEQMEQLKASGELKATVDPAEHTIEYWDQVSFEQIKMRLAQKERTNVAKNVILFLGDGMSFATVTAARIYMAIDYWDQLSFEQIKMRLAQKERTNVAKNVILFLGDGMSLATVTAARIYMGQLNGMTGEEQKLSWETFPYTGLSKTYCVNSQVADSACSSTAYLNGVKGNIKTIGVTADVAHMDWEAMQNTSYHTTSVLTWAQQAGKGTGIVTTCRVTDASPVGTYGHTASRYWQTDQDIIKDKPTATGIKDIATQLVEDMPGNSIKVILGGGRKVFLPSDVDDGYGTNGTRGDGNNLIQNWLKAKKEANVKASYVDSLDQLNQVDINNTEYLMGLFSPDHFKYNVHANLSLQPTLEQMTEVAIKMMQKETNGYFLFIEGGQIDHGHHSSLAHVALDEAYEFHKAIKKGMEMTSEDDTLIVVTADHAHTMTIAGYPARGSDIFTTVQRTDDSLYYPTLSYANGPGAISFNTTTGKAHDISSDNRTDPDYTSPSTFKLNDETHDGQDVGVWARGPGAHLLVGNYEQTVIAHVMGYAARMGPAANITDNSTDTSTDSGDASSSALSVWPFVTLTILALWLSL